MWCKCVGLIVLQMHSDFITQQCVAFVPCTGDATGMIDAISIAVCLAIYHNCEAYAVHEGADGHGDDMMKHVD